MKRRDFITVLGGAALSHLAAPARAAEPPLVGVIIPGSPPRDMLEEFRAGLSDLGYVEGRNIKLMVRWERGDASRYRKFAAEFARLPTLRAVYSPRGMTFINAMKAVETKKSLPVVGLFVTPLAAGMVENLAQHGLLVTGIAVTPPEMYGKRLQLLKEAAPNIRRVVALIHEFKGREGLTEVFVEHVKSAGKSLGIQIVLRNIDTPDDIEPAVADGVSDGADGLITTQGPFFRIHRRRLAAAAAAHRLPSITGETGYARAGGLMEYGPSIAGASRDCASLIHKILKGAKPADMPIAQPTKIKFTVNLKTSKALGLQLPRSILLRATEVIE